MDKDTQSRQILVWFLWAHLHLELPHQQFAAQGSAAKQDQEECRRRGGNKQVYTHACGPRLVETSLGEPESDP